MQSFMCTGRLTADPEIRTSQNANGEFKVANFRIAESSGRRDKDGKTHTNFFNAKAFGKTAEFIEKYFTKGMKMDFRGDWRYEDYTDKDGNRRNALYVIVSDVSFGESKSASQNSPHTAPAQSAKKDGDGFMNIPENVDEELPFA